MIQVYFVYGLLTNVFFDVAAGPNARGSTLPLDLPNDLRQTHG
jgi:hypothetical protein